MAYRQSTWEQKFLDLYKATGNVTLSAHGAGTARSNVYARRDQHPDFAARMDEAHIEAIERLEAEAWSRARKTSDTLLIFLLKALKPDMYRENIKVTIEGDVSPDKVNEFIRILIAGGYKPSDAFEALIRDFAHTDSDTSSTG